MGRPHLCGFRWRERTGAENKWGGRCPTCRVGMKESLPWRNDRI